MSDDPFKEFMLLLSDEQKEKVMMDALLYGQAIVRISEDEVVVVEDLNKTRNAIVYDGPMSSGS